MKIIDCIRPDKQTVMFSATFPRQMEALARKILTKPIEVICKFLCKFNSCVCVCVLVSLNAYLQSLTCDWFGFHGEQKKNGDQNVLSSDLFISVKVTKRWQKIELGLSGTRPKSIHKVLHAFTFPFLFQHDLEAEASSGFERQVCGGCCGFPCDCRFHGFLVIS